MFKKLLKTWRIAGGALMPEFFGGAIYNGPVQAGLTALTYGPAITINAASGNDFVVTVTDAVAFVFSAPTNSPTAPIGVSQYLAITIRNASGGAHGAGTFNAIFKTSAAVPAIANGFSRTFTFRWNGTNYVEVFRTAADVAN